MGKSFGQVMVDKLDELKARRDTWNEDDIRSFNYLYWIAEQVEDEMDDWFKRHQMAEKTIDKIDSQIHQINIWDNRDMQMEKCVREIKTNVSAYRIEYDKYSNKRVEHYTNRKEPE